MRLLPFLSTPRRLPWVYALLALVLCAPAANATTYYQVTFTTQTLLNALQPAFVSYDTTYNLANPKTPIDLADQAAVFAIFLQPTGTSAGDTLSSPVAPVTGVSNEDWQATTTGANPFGTGNGTWVEFDKMNKAFVTVVASDTVWENTTDSPNGHSVSGTFAPASWGTTAGTINNQMPRASTFTFTMAQTSGLASGTFSGYADVVYFCTPNIIVNVPFTLTATPEPGTVLLFGLGFATVLAGVIRKRAKTTPAA